MAMMTSARTVWQMLGCFAFDETLIPTGPVGAGNGGGSRWITQYDVMRYAYKTLERVPRGKEWDREASRDIRMCERNPPRQRMTLWPHQIQALCKCMPTIDTFRSGILDMECGTGKSLVGAELVRCSRAPAIVVTQHKLSVDQWLHYLRNTGGMEYVMTLQEANEFWRPGVHPFPDALVVTYAALARVLGRMDQTKSKRADEVEGTLLWMARLLPFGLLILDEVHLAAAEHFGLACSLYAKAVVGLTGSLVREDDRLALLETNVGPVLFEHRANRSIQYKIMRVGLPPFLQARIDECKRRNKDEHALRTLNPLKIKALHQVLKDPEIANRRIVVFCDSAQAAPHVARCLEGVAQRPCVGMMGGTTKQDERDVVVERFRVTERATLLSTRVCDVAVDFPQDCVIVILHSSSGSRQQEVQRCGRGTRGDVTSALVVHIVNKDTEEEGFVVRRIRHMEKLYESGFTLSDTTLDSELEFSSADGAALQSYLSSESNDQNRVGPVRSKSKALRWRKRILRPVGRS